MYSETQSKIRIIKEKLKEKMEKNPSRLYWLLKTKLFLNGVLLELTKYYILIFKDAGESFNLLVNQQNLKVCAYSYCNYKYFQKRVRIFSLAGALTIITVAVFTSLITNLIFGPKLPGQAATYNFQQTDWNTASTTNTATHPTDRSNWDYYDSKDDSVTASSTLQLSR